MLVSWIRFSLCALYCVCASACDDDLAPVVGFDAGEQDDTSLDTSKHPDASVAVDAGSTASDDSTNDEPVVMDAAIAVDSGPAQLVGEGEIGERGGTLATEGGAAVLVVAEGALSAATELTLELVEPPPEGALVALELGPPGTEFDAPVTLTLSFADVDLTGIDAARLQLAQLDADEWIVLPDAVLGLQARTLSIATMSAATYGVILGPELETAPSEPTADAGSGAPQDAGCKACLDAGVVDASLDATPDAGS